MHTGMVYTELKQTVESYCDIETADDPHTTWHVMVHWFRRACFWRHTINRRRRIRNDYGGLTWVCRQR